MSNLISRQSAITIPVMPIEHRKYQTFNIDDAYEQGWIDCQDCIKELPTVEPDRKTGKWIEIKHTFFHKCSACSWLNDVDSGYSFCPRCGSYNGGEEDEN